MIQRSSEFRVSVRGSYCARSTKICLPPHFFFSFMSVFCPVHKKFKLFHMKRKQNYSPLRVFISPVCNNNFNKQVFGFFKGLPIVYLGWARFTSSRGQIPRGDDLPGKLKGGGARNLLLHLIFATYTGNNESKKHENPLTS